MAYIKLTLKTLIYNSNTFVSLETRRHPQRHFMVPDGRHLQTNHKKKEISDYLPSYEPVQEDPTPHQQLPSRFSVHNYRLMPLQPGSTTMDRRRQPKNRKKICKDVHYS